MTKEEFDTTDKPLAMIVSLDPETGKVLYDTYDYNTANSWLEDFKKDFPNMLHFYQANNAAIKERKKSYGLI